MKDSERIGNLEELMAESLIRLDRLDDGQQRLESRMDSLDNNMLELAKNQIQLNDRQSGLQEGLIDLMQVVRKNSSDIEDIKSQVTGMATKEGLNNLFEAMMNRFDRVDERFDFMQGEIDILKSKVK